MYTDSVCTQCSIRLNERVCEVIGRVPLQSSRILTSTYITGKKLIPGRVNN